MALLSTTMSAMVSAYRSGDPVMESALWDVLTATGIVTLNRTLTSIGGNVEENASIRTNNVMEPVQPEDMNAETTCAFAKMMIPSVQLGLTAKTTEIVTEPA